MFQSPEAKQELRDGAAFIRGAINTFRAAMKLEVKAEIDLPTGLGIVERQVEKAINESIDRKADWLLEELEKCLD